MEAAGGLSTRLALSLLSLFTPLDGPDGDRDDNGRGHFPKDPTTQKFEGPWLQQQLILSAAIGLLSFLGFCAVRRRYTALFSPRTLLKGFAPHVPGIDEGLFAWILPTLRADELGILHIVGLDAAVLLSFFKMGFWLFLWLSLWSCAVLMPVNYYYNGTIDGVAPSEENGNGTIGDEALRLFALTPLKHDVPPRLPPPGQMPWTLPTVSLYQLTHIATVYVSTALILRAVYKGSQAFIRSRQLYALDLLTSIPARTVEVRSLPAHLRDEKALAEYFEAMNMPVESTSICREVGGLKDLLAKRANTLYELERTWAKWLGNPTPAKNYDPDAILTRVQQRGKELLERVSPEDIEGGMPRSLSAALAVSQDLESEPLLGGGESDGVAGPHAADGIVLPNRRPRPAVRVSKLNPFSRHVDAIALLEKRFHALDAAVRLLRKKKAPPTQVGFVTFMDAKSAQIAAQATHYPLPASCTTALAAEPRDIIWSNIALTPADRRVRQLLVSTFTFAILVFYIPPLAFLASFLSPEAFKKYLPRIWKIIESSDRLKALVSTSLPSLVLVAFNALLHMLLEWTAYLQGLRAKSLVEFSVLKRYHLFLLVSVIFIFIITRTAWGVLAELAGNPMRVMDKLAESLPGARNFSLSYVVLQSLAVMPLQLLQLPTLFMRSYWRMLAKTPRDHAELNSPPQLYAGSVYPSALIVFTLCIVYSVVSPLITIFGAVYFGIGYLVYKYKLLFVFYKSYESRGQAWQLSASRCIWALCLFQIFQLSLFSVRKQIFLTTMTLPLLAFTVWAGRYMYRTFKPLGEYINLSSISEMENQERLQQQREEEEAARSRLVDVGDSTATARAGTTATPPTGSGAGTPSLAAMRAGQQLDPTHLALSRRRYDAKDETLFVAARDRHTDYRQQPYSGYYFGTLNTGRRRYGHPALTGVLPELWLPVAEEEAEKLEEEAERREEEGVPGALPRDVPAAVTTRTPSGAEVSARPAPPTEPPTASTTTTKRSRKISGRASPGGAAAEPLVLSLRRRKSSLLLGGARGRKSSTLGSSPAAATVGGASAGGGGEAALVGDTVSGPQGSSSVGAALGEVLAGGEAVAPARERMARQARDSAGVQLDEEEGQGDDEEEEEEEEEEEQGVYMHRGSSTRGSAQRSERANGSGGRFTD